MFEDAIFESTGSIHTHSRDWMIATFALNGAVLLTLILIPLVYPEALPQQALQMRLLPPQLPPTQVPKVGVHVLQGSSDALPVVNFAAPVMPRPSASSDNPFPGADHLLSMNIGPSVPTPGIFGDQSFARVTHSDVQGPVRVSSGLMDGIVVRRVMPVYPSLAKAAGIEGTVVLQAAISKSGTIENLRVISGSAMLQQAAMDAVKGWRYKPFLLNGEPVEVETTVNVVFSLGR
jgi:protein TonB